MLWLVYERCEDCRDPQCFVCHHGKHLALRLVNAAGEPAHALGGPFRTPGEFSRYASAGGGRLFCVADDGKIYFDFDYQRPEQPRMVKNLTELQIDLNLIEDHARQSLEFAVQLPAEDQEIAQALQAITDEMARIQAVMAQLMPDTRRAGTAKDG